ncbi:hypothetical protein [Costertonia aggregata]|nr:hypothetical protein [Costertonia aggregata]
MEHVFVLFIFSIYGIIFSTVVYLIVKRVTDKKKEDFEKRDN